MAKLQSISEHVQESAAIHDDVECEFPATELVTIQETGQPPVNGNEVPIPTEETGPQTIGTATGILKEATKKYKKQKAGKSKSVEQASRLERGGLRRNCYSDPGLSTRENEEVSFDNLGFEPDIDPTSMRFADVVSRLIQDQLAEDLHPYGRGNLYRTALDGGRKTTMYGDDGKLFMWFIASLIIMGIVGAAIVMSIMYNPQTTAFNEANHTTTTPLQ